MVEMPAVGKREAKIGPWLSEAWSLTIEQKFIGLQLLIGLVVGLILAALSMTVLGPLFITMPIICGLFYFASKRIQKKPVEFGDVFRGFDVFVEGLIASLIIFVVILVMIVVIIVVNLIGMCCATVLPVIPVLLSLGAMGLLYAGTVLVPGLLFDRRMKAWDAIKVNLAYAKENLPMLFFLWVDSLCHHYDRLNDYDGYWHDYPDSLQRFRRNGGLSGLGRFCRRNHGDYSGYSGFT